MIYEIETVIVSYYMFSHKWFSFLEKTFISLIFLIGWIIGKYFLAINGWSTYYVIVSEAFLLLREFISFLISFK